MLEAQYNHIRYILVVLKQSTLRAIEADTEIARDYCQ